MCQGQGKIGCDNRLQSHVLQGAGGTAPPETADLLEPILEESARLHLVWVKSHLTEEQFRAKFPALPKWRHAANQMVDALAQKKADSRRQPEAALCLKRRDAVVTRVNQLLLGTAWWLC